MHIEDSFHCYRQNTQLLVKYVRTVCQLVLGYDAICNSNFQLQQVFVDNLVRYYMSNIIQ